MSAVLVNEAQMGEYYRIQCSGNGTVHQRMYAYVVVRARVRVCEKADAIYRQLLDVSLLKGVNRV